MRSLALVATCLCACSDSRFGTYLMIDSGRIAFDKVELFFGDAHPGERVPTSPAHPKLVAGTQYLDTRQFDPNDIAKLDAPGTSFTFYLPDSPANSAPSYVMVIASLGDQPVAIGELLDFELSRTAVFEYPIALVPFDDDAEMWGFGTPDCVRWRHLRDGDPADGPSTVAVVRHDDRDCDGYPDADDCNELFYCGPETPDDCTGITPCVTMAATGACALGACAQTSPPGQDRPITCSPTTCVAEAVCACDDPDQSLDKRLECAFKAENHEELDIPLTPMQTLCGMPYTFVVLAGQCLNPKLVYPFGGVEDDGFGFDVMPMTDDTCIVSMTPPASGDPRFRENDDHVVIEVDALQGSLPRTTFVFGVHPGQHDPTACGTTVIASTSGPEVCP